MTDGHFPAPEPSCEGHATDDLYINWPIWQDPADRGRSDDDGTGDHRQRRDR